MFGATARLPDLWMAKRPQMRQFRPRTDGILTLNIPAAPFRKRKRQILMMKNDQAKKTGAAKTSGTRKGRAATVDRELQVKIGAQLRAMHDDVIQEGVPDRFRELLSRLDRSKPKG